MIAVVVNSQPPRTLRAMMIGTRWNISAANVE